MCLSMTGSKPAPIGTACGPPRHLGYAGTATFASPGGLVDARNVYTYTAPSRMELNEWALSGDWTIDRYAAVPNAADGRIAFRFHARDLHLVMPRPREWHPSGFEC